MAVYASQQRTDVPSERKGYVRYVLEADGEVPQGEPKIRDAVDGEGKKYQAITATTNRFHKAGEVVSVHKQFPRAKTWRVYEPPKEP